MQLRVAFRALINGVSTRFKGFWISTTSDLHLITQLPLDGGASPCLSCVYKSSTVVACIDSNSISLHNTSIRLIRSSFLIMSREEANVAVTSSPSFSSSVATLCRHCITKRTSKFHPCKSVHSPRSTSGKRIA